MRKTILLGAVLLAVQIPLVALTLLQERTWGGAADDRADEVAIASDGSVYVAGTTETADGDRDVFLLKYRPDRTLAMGAHVLERRRIRSRALTTSSRPDLLLLPTAPST